MSSIDFAGKTAVITGAARGLGAALAVVLADKGAHVSNRDIVETALFALSRPRNVTLASIIIDSDEGGLFAR